MFVKGTFKKVSILFTLALFPIFLGYSLITFLLFSFITFLMQFFRDPHRKVPFDKGIVVAPADGRILKGKIDQIEIVNSDYPLMEHLLQKNQKGILISTFMSPFDVHVNRAPVSGKVIKTKYCPGKFKFAFGEIKTENEKNLIVIDSTYGKIGIIQIAGFLARRIVQYVALGDEVEIGSRLGMICFGSRVDLIVPRESFELLVNVGEKPKAGETILARFKDLKS